jgi:hypothetical protein
MGEDFEFLKQSIASHDRQIGELTDRLAEVTEQIAAQTANINKLVEVTNQDATAIRQLAAIAQRHEERLDDLEGGR